MTTTNVLTRTLEQVLSLREVVSDPPFTDPQVREIIARMANGGWTVVSVATTDFNGKKFYGVSFNKWGEDEEIHVTGQIEIVRLFEAALKEAHRRHREGVQSSVQ